MATNNDIGYVYIFTNDSFREGWIKIGKTKNIEKRLNDLDNTSCPLPFDVYATLKTTRYEDAETFVHEFISHFNRDLRVRPNREYFKVSPKEALEILHQVKRLMNEEGSEITVYDKKSNSFANQLKKRYEKVTPSKQLKSGNQAIWLICYDNNGFDVEKCFLKYGQVYWKHKSGLQNVKMGDVAYLYCNSPKSAIRYKVEVVDSQLPYSPVMDIEDEFSKQKKQYKYDDTHRYFLVRPIGETCSEALKHSVMLRKGLIGKRPSVTILSKKQHNQLLNYIVEHFDERHEEPVEDENFIIFTQELKQSGGKCQMTYYPESKRYVINKGSNIVELSKNTCGKGMYDFREKIKEDPNLSRNEGNLYTLLEDIEIPSSLSSPTGASKFVWGTSRPGPDDWIDKDGKKYPKEWWR